jgi:hypothetical protein
MSKVLGKKDLESKIIKKAWEDEKFKNELLTDPKSAIQKALEVNIPEGINIKVVEETAETLYLVLPQNPTVTGSKLDLNSDKLEAQTPVY